MINCPNCGKHDFNNKKEGFECPKCGFKKPNLKQLEDVDITFCDACGCHYSSPGCTTHGKDKQRIVKFNG